MACGGQWHSLGSGDKRAEKNQQHEWSAGILPRTIRAVDLEAAAPVRRCTAAATLRWRQWVMAH